MPGRAAINVGITEDASALYKVLDDIPKRFGRLGKALNAVTLGTFENSALSVTRRRRRPLLPWKGPSVASA